jgi:hypothetical protein
VDFKLLESDYSKIPEFLKQQIGDFETSPEYTRLNETERELPGVVAAAFTQFLVRLQTSALHGASDIFSTTLKSAYNVLELLSGSSESRIRTLVRDEIFENILAEEDVWESVEAAFGPKTRALYDDWRRKNPENS